SRVGSTQIRVIATKGKAELGRYALEVTAQILQYYNDYFGVPYPLPKLDQIALPGGFGGAMENWGGITYFESALLFDPKNSSAHTKQVIFAVVAHEMAHQWFGDLVTMAWWDDIWLNEAFATWITPKIVDGWKPEWRSGLDQLQGTFYAAGADSLVSARCIRQPIKSAPDIDNAFDGITYDKGAAVLGMFESSIGGETFRKAIKA